MRMRKWECAESEFTKAADADPRFVEPRIMLAEIAEQQGKDDVAMARYLEVMAVAPTFFPVGQLHLADLEFKAGHYAEAEKNYKGYLAQEEDPLRKARAAGLRIAPLQPVRSSSPSLRAEEPGPQHQHRRPRVLPMHHGRRRYP